MVGTLATFGNYRLGGSNMRVRTQSGSIREPSARVEQRVLLAIDNRRCVVASIWAICEKC